MTAADRIDPATLSPAEFMEALNTWPPFVGQAISLTHLEPDWTSATVQLALTPTNANYFGTAFGGSLFSMVDPFVVILLARQLGPGYAVWDKRVEIDFLRPGTTTVSATITMDPATVAHIRTQTATGEPHIHQFEVPIVATDDTVVAVQQRHIYVRKQRS